MALALLAASANVPAQQMPQDNWARGNVICCVGEQIYGHDFDRFGNLFIATSRAGGRLLKFDRRFVEVASVPVTLAGQVRTDAQGNVYQGSGNAINKFDNDLVPQGSVTIPAGFAVFEVLNDGSFAVVGNDGLQVFDAGGSFVRNIGVKSCNGVLGSICAVIDLDVYPTGEILVRDHINSLNHLSVFAVDGSLRGRTQVVLQDPGGAALLPGNIVGAIANGAEATLYLLPDPRVGGDPFATLPIGFMIARVVPGIEIPSLRVRASPSGDLVIAGEVPNDSGTQPPIHMPAGFRAIGPAFGPSPAPARTAIPQPRVDSVVRRPSSTIVDIGLRVFDEDDATVDARILALRGGSASIDSVVKMTTLVDGTAAAIGPGTPANTLRTVSWDAAADLGTANPTVSLTFRVLARDARGLVDLDFVSIPAGLPNGADPLLVISRSPLTDADLLGAWLWLLASNDSRVALVADELRASGGPLDGQLLATGTQTTAAGRAFLFDVLGVRAATAGEIMRAREASTPGVVNQFAPRNGMGYLARPVAVNQFGIDTGSSGHWVVLP